MITESIDDWVKQNGIGLAIIAERGEIPPPKIKTLDNIRFLFDGYSETNRLFLANIKDLFVFGGSGRLVSENKRIEISEFSDDGALDWPNRKPFIVESGIHLVAPYGGTNYWHWMTTSLARLSLIDKIPKNVKYIINSLEKKFVVDSLNLMGISPVEADKEGIVFCENLSLPSKLGDRNGIGQDFLRKSLRMTACKNSPRRVYISRASSLSRNVTNEDEVFSFLSKMKFQKVKCEELSFQEQIEYFSNAEVVVAPHGAGLTNLLFAKDGVKVLELRSPKYFGKCYCRLCYHLGIDYFSLYGAGKAPKTVREAMESLDANMTINMDSLKKTMEMMGIC